MERTVAAGLGIRFWPIVERELRRLARRPLTYHVRTGAALAAALISLGVLATNVIAGTSPATLGRNLFLPLALLSFGFSVMTGPVLTADCLSEEKRGGTLGLLFLTNLNGFHLVAGKLIAMALPALHCLLAAIPILAISFFMGGVTGGEFFRTAALLGTTLLFSLASAMLASALCVDGRKALAGTVIFLLAVTAGLPAAELLASGGKIAAQSLRLLPSPGYALWLLPEAGYLKSPGHFWASLAIIQGLSWLSLVLAAVALSHTWQDRPAGGGGFGKGGSASKYRGTGARRRRRREKLLSANPVLWLAARTGRGSTGLWIFLAGVLTFWWGGYYSLHKNWLSAEVVFGVIYCLHAVLKLWIGWEAGRRFAEDRASGSLELLLCTPLGEANILAGWLTHLRRRFLPPIVALLFVDLLLVQGGLSGRGWWGGNATWVATFIASMGLFVADTYALCWVGLWQGLTARNAMRATLKTFLYVLVLPLVGCLGVLGVLSLAAIPSGLPLGALTALWFAVGYIVDAALCGRAMTQLQDEFRTAAAQGLAAGPVTL